MNGQKTLRILPKSWFSWDFTVADGPRPIADIDMSVWRERAQLTIDGRPYEVYREGLMSGAFVLASGETVLARAEKPSAVRRSFDVESGGERVTLRARSAFRRELVLLAGSQCVGGVVPDSAFTRRARAELPSRLPLPVDVFIIWLTVLLWKRAAQSNAA